MEVFFRSHAEECCALYEWNRPESNVICDAFDVPSIRQQNSTRGQVRAFIRKTIKCSSCLPWAIPDSRWPEGSRGRVVPRKLTLRTVREIGTRHVPEHGYLEGTDERKRLRLVASVARQRVFLLSHDGTKEKDYPFQEDSGAWPHTKRNPATMLPPELLVRMVKYLDPYSALRLSKTCAFFCRFVYGQCCERYWNRCANRNLLDDLVPTEWKNMRGVCLWKQMRFLKDVPRSVYYILERRDLMEIRANLVAQKNTDPVWCYVQNVASKLSWSRGREAEDEVSHSYLSSTQKTLTFPLPDIHITKNLNVRDASKRYWKGGLWEWLEAVLKELCTHRRALAKPPVAESK